MRQRPPMLMPALYTAVIVGALIAVCTWYPTR
jgi:hypothetical protein